MHVGDNENVFKGYMLAAGPAPTRSMDMWRRGRRPINFINFGDPLLAIDQIDGATEVLAQDRPLLALYMPDALRRERLPGCLRDRGYETVALSRLAETELESEELDFGCIAVPAEQLGAVLQRFHSEKKSRKHRPSASDRLLDRIAVPRQRQSGELFGLHAKSPPGLNHNLAMSEVSIRSNCYPVESEGARSWRWLGPGASARMALPCSFPGAYNFEFTVMACRTPAGLTGCRAVVEGRESVVSIEGTDKGSVRFSGWLDPAEYKGYAEVDLINPGHVPQAGTDPRILRMNVTSVRVSPCA
jgi:hypothetical protein